MRLRFNWIDVEVQQSLVAEFERNLIRERVIADQQYNYCVKRKWVSNESHKNAALGSVKFFSVI